MRYRWNLPLLSAFAQCLLTSHNIFSTTSLPTTLLTTPLLTTPLLSLDEPSLSYQNLPGTFLPNSVRPEFRLAILWHRAFSPIFFFLFFFFFFFIPTSPSRFCLPWGQYFAVTRRIFLKLTSYPFLSTPGPISVMFLSYLFSLLLPFLTRSTLPSTTHFNSHIVLNSTRAHACLSTPQPTEKKKEKAANNCDNI